MKRSILAGLLGLACACAPQGPPAQSAGQRSSPAQAAVPGRRHRPLHFESELVRLRLDAADSLEVDGFYRFLCSESAPERYSLLYPFPEDDMGGVRVLDCEYRAPGEAWQPMAYDWVPAVGGIIWRLPLAGSPRCEVRTRYRQALVGPSARYIVTTTRGWERPLALARFEVFIAPELGKPRFDQPFAPCASLGERAWCYETEDFWPQEDIIVRWNAED